MVWRVVLGIGVLCVPQFAILTFATVFLHDAARFGVPVISATMGTIQARRNGDARLERPV
ncbi:MAG: Permeases of the major facilitator superfamily [uncultured Caballeronia sp.]|nr:MAG: Permeases of the major facilitator superfamily [uncultured Caballeronia sp.]